MKRAAILIILAMILGMGFASALQDMIVLSARYYELSNYDFTKDEISCQNGIYKATFLDNNQEIKVTYYKSSGRVLATNMAVTDSMGGRIVDYFTLAEKKIPALCSTAPAPVPIALTSNTPVSRPVATQAVPRTTGGTETEEISQVAPATKGETQNWEVTFSLDSDYWGAWKDFAPTYNFSDQNITLNMVCNFIGPKNGVCNSAEALDLLSQATSAGRDLCSIPMFFQMTFKNGKVTIGNCIELQKSGVCKKTGVLKSPPALPGCQTDQKYPFIARKSTGSTLKYIVGAPIGVVDWALYSVPVVSSILTFLYNPAYIGKTVTQKFQDPSNPGKIISGPTSVKGGRVFFRVFSTSAGSVITPSAPWTAKRTDALTVVGRASASTATSRSQPNVIE